MSPVASQQKHVIKANLAKCLKMVAMVTDICRSVPKRIYFLFSKLQHKVTILYSSLTSFAKCQIGMSVYHEKATKMLKTCGVGVINWPYNYR